MTGTRRAGFPHDGEVEVEAHLVESESGEETEPEPGAPGDAGYGGYAPYRDATERERLQREARRAYEQAGGITAKHEFEEGVPAQPVGAPTPRPAGHADEKGEAPSGEGVAGQEASAAPGAPESPEEKLTSAIVQRDEYLDALRRVQAEFENYRKRVMRNETAAAERASERLVEKLLPVLDTVDQAQRHAALGQPVEGAVGMIATALADALGREGLERIEPEGQPFDPAEQEAVAHIPAGEGVPAGADNAVPEVVEVMRPGYRFKGRVVRPAMVKVRG